MKSKISRVGMRSGTVVLVTLLASPASASDIVSLNNPGSTMLHEVWVAPGETFDVNLTLDTDRKLVWVRTAIVADAAGIFEITHVATRDAWSTYLALGPLDPATEQFNTALPVLHSFAPGNAALVEIRFTVEPTASVATYALSLADPKYTTSYINPVGPFVALSGPDFIVHVIPEPGGSLLALIAMSAILRRPTARQRA